jgi:replicative DNA helicase
MRDVPNCQKSEDGFIGCVLASNGDVLDEHPATLDHFLNPANQVLAGVCIQLHSAGAPVDASTVTQKLIDGDLLNKAGGPARIAEISFVSHSTAGYFYGILCEKLMLRRAMAVCEWGSRSAVVVQEPSEFVADLQRRVSEIDTTADAENLVDSVVDEINEKMDKWDRGIYESGFQTGIEAWDRGFGGLFKGEYYALGGRPGSGKSCIMEQIITQYILRDKPVAVFEKDMSPRKLIERIACREEGVPYWKFARGRVTRDETARLREMLAALKESPLYLYNPEGLTAEKLCSILKRAKRIHKIEAGFLDHIQVLKVKGDDMRAGLTQSSTILRSCVTELDIPFLTLCHLNRNGASGRPKPEDIKEFDQLYGDVDGMGLLWSEKEPEPGDMAEINMYIAKNRDGAKIEIPMLFDGAMLTFRNKAKE